MADKAEKSVAEFYSTTGWTLQHGVTEDARRWEDLREHAADYVASCRLRLLKHIPASGENMLDMASGPIQYPEYLTYSQGFRKRYCVDLSADALALAKQKIGDHGEYLLGSFLDLELPESFFDCTISLHTIYHIDKHRQEEAIRKLLHVTKPERPVIIIYSNPDSLGASIGRLVRKMHSRSRRLASSELYFFAHPLSWWSRFHDEAEIRIFPWRTFAANTQRRLFPDNRLGKAMLRLLFRMEDRYPNFFAKYAKYPMIVLTKKSDR